MIPPSRNRNLTIVVNHSATCSDGEKGGKTTLLLGLPQLSALVRGRLDEAGMAAFALTEEVRVCVFLCACVERGSGLCV